MSLVCSWHLQYFWQAVTALGFVVYTSGVSLTNCRGRQVTQDANFYIMLLEVEDTCDDVE